VELADGWSPFPNPARVATRTRTAALQTTEDLAESVAYARGYADTIGRADPLSVVFIPDGLSMGDEGEVDEDRVLASIRELEAIGVDWVSVALPGDTRDAQRAAIERFGNGVLAEVSTP
jgi:hypothetical protein